jgi:hypothetical protein
MKAMQAETQIPRFARDDKWNSGMTSRILG